MEYSEKEAAIKETTGLDADAEQRSVEIFMQLYEELDRLGPGDDTITVEALGDFQFNGDSEILDIGCGTGAQTIALARHTGCRITAVDFHGPFLDRLKRRAEDENLHELVTVVQSDMAALPPEIGQYDIIWSEGAIYSMGFQQGVLQWRKHLKSGGLLAITDMVRFVDQLPDEVEAFWQRQNLQLSSADKYMKFLEENGFTEVKSFRIPDLCWDNYYSPLEKRLQGMEQHYAGDSQAEEVFYMTREEISTFKKWGSTYGYSFFTAIKG